MTRNSGEQKPMRYRLRTLLIVLALGPLMLAVIPCFITGYHDHYTCVLCRAIRTDYIYLGHKWRTSFKETACTPWYQANIEPTHDHVWVRSRDSVMRDLYGQRFGTFSRDPRAIWSLAPEDQIAIYEHLPQRDKKRIFLSLAAPNSANGGDYEIVRALQHWKESGFKAATPSFTEE
jgi:hypothetical protein